MEDAFKKALQVLVLNIAELDIIARQSDAITDDIHGDILAVKDTVAALIHNYHKGIVIKRATSQPPLYVAAEKLRVLDRQQRVNCAPITLSKNTHFPLADQCTECNCMEDMEYADNPEWYKR